MEVSGKRADYVSEACELCLIEGLSTQADGFCNDCYENMCNKCFRHHVKVKACRNHVLSPLGQSVLHGKKQAECNEKCKAHVREYVKYYCRKHDMVTCGDCIVGDHQGCKVEFISKLADQFEISSEFKDIIRKIEKLETEQKENKSQLDTNRKENKSYLGTALAEIKKFRKDINEHIDKMEKEIIFEANRMAKQNDDIIDQLENMLSVAEQDISDIRNNLDANMIQGDTLFIRTKEYKPKLIKVDESVSLIRTKNVIRGFTFEQEKQLADMIKSGVKLGCIKRDTVTEEEPAVIKKTKQPVETVKPVMTRVTADKRVDAKQSYPLTEEAPTLLQKSRQSTDTVKPVLPVSAGKTVEVKQTYLPPGAEPCSLTDTTIHYSWDFAQQVFIPHHSQQVGTIFFKTPRKCEVFGVCCEGSEKQVFFLCDEGLAPGKGANTVISYVHHYLATYGLGETTAQFHFDNCCAQNKNNAVLWYAMWRVMTGLHVNIHYNLMVAGHTKFSPDWHFGLWKSRWRRIDAETVEDVATSVHQSSKNGHNVPHIVDNHTSPVPFYNWKKFLGSFFRPLKNITKYHSFRVSSCEPGVVVCKEFSDSQEVRVSLLHKGASITPGILPDVLYGPGLDAERQWYLFEHIRPFFKSDSAKNLTCPLPKLAKVQGCKKIKF